LSAGLAAHYGVPVGFVSGDDKLEKQVKKIAPWVKVAVTKFSISRNSAKMLHPDRSLELLERRAFEAVRDIKDMRVYKHARSLDIKVDFSRTTHADVVCQIPILKRLSGRRIGFKCKNFRDFYNLFSAIVTLAHTVK